LGFVVSLNFSASAKRTAYHLKSGINKIRKRILSGFGRQPNKAKMRHGVPCALLAKSRRATAHALLANTEAAIFVKMCVTKPNHNNYKINLIYVLTNHDLCVIMIIHEREVGQHERNISKNARVKRKRENIAGKDSEDDRHEPIGYQPI